MIAAAALALALLSQEAPAERAGDELVRVEVTCNAISGSSVYLDLGREAGFASGDRVRLFPPSGPPRRGKISSVSRTSSRAEIDGGIAGLEIGLRGEVWIPSLRLRLSEEPSEETEGEEPLEATPAEIPPAPTPAQPEVLHPPWTSPPEEWSRDMPLLAPAHGATPEERPRRLIGRTFTSFDWTKDSADSEDRQTYAGTLGFDGRIENPFAHGGRLAFDAELFGRRFHTEDSDEDESRLRIDRASYAWGGVRSSPSRGEVGRFLQNELPALGFLDGLEYVSQINRTQRLGASVGFLPIPDDLFRTGDDLQAALFYRGETDGRGVSFGTGYQKTWHKGVADRDLIVGELDLHPSRSTSLFSSASVDFYTSGDDLKDSGPELTQLFMNASHRGPSGHGMGIFFSRFRWPQLKRDEFPDVAAEEIADAVSTRYGADGWLALGPRTQLYGRLDTWSDQDNSGNGGRVRVTWRDLLWRGDVVSLESFVNDAKFTRSLGLRASARRRLARGAFDVSWDSTRFLQDEVDEELTQHAVRSGFEWNIGSRWFLALYAESRFGDDQDALSVGFLLQRSFD